MSGDQGNRPGHPTNLEISMLALVKGLVLARPSPWLLLLAALPLVLAACTNGGGSSGY